MKEKLAQEIASRVSDGDVLGIGTGSTVELAIIEIGKRIHSESLTIGAVPTSYHTSLLCAAAGFLVLSPVSVREVTWGFDGADEVDPQLNLIKGRGGALLQEKILASKCESFVVVVDESKLVKKLGQRCAVPVEVIPSAISFVHDELMALGATVVEQRGSDAIYRTAVTEAGNLLLDAKFKEIKPKLEQEIKRIVGVVESGIFIGYADEVLVATKKGIISRRPGKTGSS